MASVLDAYSYRPSGAGDHGCWAGSPAAPDVLVLSGVEPHCCGSTQKSGFRFGVVWGLRLCRVWGSGLFRCLGSFRIVQGRLGFIVVWGCSGFRVVQEVQGC